MKTTISLALALTAATFVAQPAQAQIIRPGSGTVVVRDPSGVIVGSRTNDGRVDPNRAPGSNRMRVYRDAQGCLVKEQTKRNGDYRYERKCNGRAAQQRNANGTWRTINSPTDRWWDRYDRNGRLIDRNMRDDDSDRRFDNDSDRRGGNGKFKGKGNGKGKGHGKH